MTHRTPTGARAVGRMPRADSGISARVALRSARLSAQLAWTAAPLGCVASVLFMIVSGVTPSANAWLQREILDALVEAPAAGHQAPGRARIDLMQGPLLGLAIALCGLALVTAVVPYTRRYIESEMRRRLGLLLQDNVYRAINSFPGMGRLSRRASPTSFS